MQDFGDGTAKFERYFRRHRLLVGDAANTVSAKEVAFGLLFSHFRLTSHYGALLCVKTSLGWLCDPNAKTLRLLLNNFNLRREIKQQRNAVFPCGHAV